MSLHRDRYTSLLPFRFYSSSSKSMEVRLLTNPSTVVWRHVGMHDFARRLELATSVFRHPCTYKILIGRDVCHAWKMGEELRVSRTRRGAAAIRALIWELQLDSATTTLSVLDKRLICACCPNYRLVQPIRPCDAIRMYVEGGVLSVFLSGFASVVLLKKKTLATINTDP
jgi:hypothetical protein